MALYHFTDMRRDTHLQSLNKIGLAKIYQITVRPQTSPLIKAVIISSILPNVNNIAFLSVDLCCLKTPLKTLVPPKQHWATTLTDS